MDNEIQKLYEVLSREGYYTKSIEDFSSQFEDAEYRDKVYGVVSREGLYTKSKDDFEAKYYKKKDSTDSQSVGVQEDTTSESESEAQPIMPVEPPKFIGAVGTDKAPRKKFEVKRGTRTEEEKKEEYEALFAPVEDLTKSEEERAKIREEKGFKDEELPTGIRGGSEILYDLDLEKNARAQKALTAAQEYENMLEEHRRAERSEQTVGGYGMPYNVQRTPQELADAERQAKIDMGAALGWDADIVEGYSYEELRNYAEFRKNESENYLNEYTLEKAIQKEAEDPTKLGFTRTAFWDAFITTPAKELAIQLADANGDYKLAEQIQQDINARKYQTQISLGIDPNDSRGVVETWGESESLSDYALAVTKGYLSVAESTGGLLFTIANPTAGTAYFGGTAYNSTYNQFRDRADLSYEEKQSLALVAGATEIAVAKVFGGLNNIRRFRRSLGIADDIGRATTAQQRAAYNNAIEFLEPISKRTADALKNPVVKGVAKTAYETASEALEEGAVSIVNQVAAHIVANDEFDPYEIYDAMVIGGFMGGTMGVRVGRQASKAQRLQNSTYSRPLASDMETFETLQKEYAEIKADARAEKDSERKAKLFDVAKEIKSEIDVLTEKAKESYDGLSEEEVSALGQTHKEISKLSREISQETSEPAKARLKRKLKRAIDVKTAIEKGEAKKAIPAEPDFSGVVEQVATNLEQGVTLDQAVAETTERRVEAEQRVEPTTPKQLLNKRGRYLNRADNMLVEGVVSQDGQTVVIETDEGNIIEIGNIDEIGDTPLQDLGLSAAKDVVSVDADGVFTYNSVAGAAPQGTNMIPSTEGLKSIRRAKDGTIKRVVMKSPDGKETYNLTGQDAQDVAYQLYLQQMQTAEGEAKVESELQKDEEARRIIEAAERAAESSPAVEEAPEARADEGAKQDIPKRTRAGRIEGVNIELTEEQTSELEKVQSVLAEIAPNVSIVIHKDRSSYDKTYANASKSKGHYNSNTNTIHILMESVSNEIDGKILVRHEAVHPILDAYLQNSPELTAQAADSVRRILSRMGKDANAKRVLDHASQYTDKAVEDLELVTEFLAVFSQADNISAAQKANPKFLERLRNLLNNILSKIGVIDYKDKLESDKEVLSFLSRVNFAFETGAEFQAPRQNNAKNSHTNSIVESLSNVSTGKDPYKGAASPNKGEAPAEVLKQWKASGSNFIIAKDFEHSLELRRIGFVEAFERANGSIVMGTPVSYESYDASTGVSRLSPKTFITEASVEGKTAKQVAKTISALGKLAGRSPKFINRPDLPFSSSMVLPDRFNELSEPTIVVNLAFANERTGASGYSYFILETLRNNNPALINKLFKGLDNTDKTTAETYSTYLDFLNTYEGLNPYSTSKIKDGDKELIAMSRVFQEILDDAINSVDPSATANEIQDALSDIINRSVENEGSVVISKLPMGDNFLEAINAAFEANLNPQPTTVSEAENQIKTNIVEKVLSKTANQKETDLSTVSNAAKKIAQIAKNFGGGAYTMLDIFSMGNMTAEAINYFAKNARSLEVVMSKDNDFLGEIADAYNNAFTLRNEIADNPQKVKRQLAKYIDSGFTTKAGPAMELFKSIYESSPKRFQESVYDGKEIDLTSLSVVVDKMVNGSISTIVENITDDRKKIRSVGDRIVVGDALHNILDGMGQDISSFIEGFDSTGEMLDKVYNKGKALKEEGKLKQSIENVKTAKEAYDLAKNVLGKVDKEGVFTKDFTTELKEYVKRVHGDNIPKGSEYLFGDKANVSLQVEAAPDPNGYLVVQYQFIVNGKPDGWVEYPSNWKMAYITMPLVFEWTNSIGAVLNSKGVTFKAVDSVKHPKIPNELYTKSDLEKFSKRGKGDKGVGNYKRRGLNNNIALKVGNINTNRTSRNVGFYFKESFDIDGVTVSNEGYYTSGDIALLDIVNLNKNEIQLNRLNSVEAGEKIGEILRAEHPEVLKKIAADSKSFRNTDNVETGVESVNESSYTLPAAEFIPNNAPMRSTFNNSEKFITPAAIRESLSEARVKGEDVAAANSVDSMFESSEKYAMEMSKSKKWNWKYLTSRKAWVDRSTDLKKAMSQGMSRYVESLFVNKAGATSYADRLFQKARKEIYAKITNTERELIDKLIFLRRVIDIDSTFEERFKEYTEKAKLEKLYISSFEAELEKAKAKKDKTLISEIKEDIKDSKKKLKYFESKIEQYESTPLHPSADGVIMNKATAESVMRHYRRTLPAETFALMEERAERYFEEYRKILQLNYEAGLIDEETRDRFINNDYSPRVFLEKMFSSVDDITFQSQGLSTEQIQAIRSGSDTGIFTDTEYLLDLSYRALENKKAKNKLYSQMYKEANKQGFENIADGKFIKDGNAKKRANGKIKEDGFGNYMYESADKGYKHVFFREDGKLRAFQVADEYYAQLTGLRASSMSPVLRKSLKWITGTQIVKATATALNPFFAITGTIRGFREVTRGRGVYDKYRFLPLMNAMVFIDFVKASKDAVSKNSELVEEYYAHGGGLSFMTTQGKPDKLYKRKRRLGIEYFQKRGINLSPFHALSYAGEKAELALRLAVYERTKIQLKESMPDATDSEINSMAAAEARLIADFAQGGELSSDVDLVVPYFNAAIQGTRASYDYARKNPKKFISKQVQSYMLNTALAMFARTMLWDDEEDKDYYENVSPWIKERYNIIPTGLKNNLGEPVTIRIPKVHQFLMFDALSEITAKKLTYAMKDKDAPKDDLNPDGDAMFLLESILASFTAGQFIPLTDVMRGKNIFVATGQRLIGAVPVASAGIAYGGNYDMFRKKIISYDKGEVMPSAEGYKDAYVHDIYKFLGDVTAGMEGGSISPKRLEVATEKIIGSESTLLTALVYQMTDKFLTVKEETEGVTPEKAQKQFQNLFGFGRSFIYSIPKEKYTVPKNEDELINMRAMTSHSKIKKNLRLIAGKYTVDEMIKAGRLPKELETYIEGLDEPEVVKGYYLKYFRNISKGNMVEDDKYFKVKYAKTPKAEKDLFLTYFGRPEDLTPEELGEISRNFELIGYKPSDSMKAYLFETK